MSKHTPGPWYAYSLLVSGIHAGYRYGIANTKPCGVISDEDGVMHPDFPDWNPSSRIIAKTTDSDTARDDARLIAAAPDLLAACEAFVELQTYGKQLRPGFLAAKDIARAAIAKATGTPTEPSRG